MTPSGNLILLVEPYCKVGIALLLSFLPGWGIANRLKVDSLTRLLAAILISYTLMYLLEWGAYWVAAPRWVPALLLLLFAGLSIAYSKQHKQAEPFPWDGVLACLAVVLWITALQGRIVVYGGARWFGDWYEHYERTLFFLDRLSPDTRFLMNSWILPARGPMFNSSAACLMSLLGRDFWVYQLVSSLLNSLPLLPFALMLIHFGGFRRGTALLWSVAIMSIAPFAVEQETYTWSKFFAVGFVLAGMYFYWMGSRQKRSDLILVSFAVFAAGILAHYLVGIYVLFFAAHFLIMLSKGKWEWRTAGQVTLYALLLLGTWFGYCIPKYGLKGVVAANSTFGNYAGFQASKGEELPPWSSVFVSNFITTTIPYSWRHGFTGRNYAPPVIQADGRGGPQYFPSPQEWNRRFEWFCDLNNNVDSFTGALGWTGCIGVLIATLISVRRKPISQEKEKSTLEKENPEPNSVFWVVFFGLGIPLNIFASRNFIVSGVTHLNLQPYLFLTAFFVLSRLSKVSMTLRIILLSLFLAESALVTGAIQSLQERPVPITMTPDGQMQVHGKLNINYKYLNNYIYKQLEKVVFLSDRLQDLTIPYFFIGLAISFIPMLILISRAALDFGSGPPT